MEARWPLLPIRRRRLPAAPTLLDRYQHAAPRPMYCLVFLLPLAAIYEIGVLTVAAGEWPARTLVAQSLMQGLFGWIGATGYWLPLFALIVTLLGWQVASGARWKIRPWIPAVMIGESVLLAIPLLVLRGVLLHAGEPGPTRAGQLILGLGAGVYEELVFRLYLIAALTLLLVGVCRLKVRVALPIIVASDALIFAACHFQPIGADVFTWSSFIVRSLAGGYLALLFLTRGLGIATGCHVTNNVIGVLA